MSRKHNAKGRSKSCGPFTMVREDMQASAAWRGLSPVARAVWLEIALRYKGGANEVSLSKREAAALVNVGDKAALRGLNDLQERGFIKVAIPAGFSQKSGRRATRWRLTHQPTNGQPATNEWRLWEPSKKNHGGCEAPQTSKAVRQDTTNRHQHPLVVRQNTANPNFEPSCGAPGHQSIDIYQNGGARHLQSKQPAQSRSVAAHRVEIHSRCDVHVIEVPAKPYPRDGFLYLANMIDMRSQPIH